MTDKMAKTAIIFLIVMLFSLLGMNIYVDLSYDFLMPRTANPVSGKIYQIEVNHGALVFVNKREFAFASTLFVISRWLGPTLVIVISWANMKYKPFEKDLKKQNRAGLFLTK